MRKVFILIALSMAFIVTSCGSPTTENKENSSGTEKAKPVANKEADKQKEKEEEKAAERNKKQSETNATVTRVIDGDTIEIRMNGKTEDVRLLLIDTPETIHPSKPIEPFGPEASQFVKETLAGKKVRIKVGSEKRDKYGRLLAYVFINEETIQEMLLSKG